MGSEGLNLGPQVRAASTFPTEPSLQPCNVKPIFYTDLHLTIQKCLQSSTEHLPLPPLLEQEAKAVAAVFTVMPGMSWMEIHQVRTVFLDPKCSRQLTCTYDIPRVLGAPDTKVHSKVLQAQ